MAALGPLQKLASQTCVTALIRLGDKQRKTLGRSLL